MNTKKTLASLSSSSIGICLLSGLLFFNSCQEETKTKLPVQTIDKSTKSTPTLSQNTPVSSIIVEASPAHHQAVETIVGDASKGVIRGVDFSMTKAGVKAEEKTANFVRQINEDLLYETDLMAHEFVDLNYIFDKNNTLATIRANVYSRSKDSARQMQLAFEEYFAQTYEKINPTTWKGADLTVYIRLLTGKIDTGVIVEWRKNKEQKRVE